MTGYSIRLATKMQKVIAIVNFSGDCTIDTSGYVVSTELLSSLRIAADEYNVISDTEYPVNATGADIQRIDKKIEDSASFVRQIAAQLAASARKEIV